MVVLWNCKSLSPSVFDILSPKHMGPRPWPCRATWHRRSLDHFIHKSRYFL